MFIVVHFEIRVNQHGIAVQSYFVPEVRLFRYAANVETDIAAVQPVDLQLSHAEVVRRRRDMYNTGGRSMKSQGD